MNDDGNDEIVGYEIVGFKDHVPPSTEDNLEEEESPEAIEPPDKTVLYTHGWLKKFGPLLNESERRVYDVFAINYETKFDGLVWMDQGKLAESAGYQRRQTVGEAIRGLKAKGLIDIIDWPITVMDHDAGERFRNVGGGRGSGTHNVFILLHVDDSGYHREKRVRPNVQELRRTHEESADLPGILTQMVLQGKSYKSVREYVISKYPFATNIPIWCVPDDIVLDDLMQPENFGFDSMLMAGVLLPINALRGKYPDVGKPDMGLILQHPTHGDPSLIGERAFGPYRQAAQALEESGKAEQILREASDNRGKFDLPAMYHGRPPGLKEVAPAMFEMSEKLNVAPAHLVPMARDIAIKSGMVIMMMNEDGEGVAIDCKDPDEFVDDATKRLALLSEQDLTEHEAQNREETDQLIRAAQQRVRETFFHHLLRGSEPDEADKDLRTLFTVNNFNDWVQQVNGRTYAAPLIPLIPTDANEARALACAVAERKGEACRCEAPKELAFTPALNETDRKIADYIRAHPGEKGLVIAAAVVVTQEHFRRVFSTKLAAHGFTNPGNGDGYFPPPA
jgi:hypothetical protein